MFFFLNIEKLTSCVYAVNVFERFKKCDRKVIIIIIIIIIMIIIIIKGR